MKSQNVQVVSRRFHYFEGGDPSAQTVVILHGWAMDGAAYCRLGELLVGDFHVLIPDLPGFGKSKRLWTPEIDGLSYTLAAFLKKIGKGKVVIVGHSVGGAVGLRLAQIYPKLVSQLVLIDSTGVPVQRSVLGWGRAAVTKALRSLRYPRGLYQVLRAFSWNVICHPYWMVRTFRTTVRCDLTGYPKPNVPVTILWADRDDYYPMGDELAMACGTYVHYVHANHDWPILRPELAANRIREYVLAAGA